MNCAGPCDGERHVQSIEASIAKLPFVDLYEYDGPAITVCRQRIELTGAAVRTAAVHEEHPMNFPIGHGLHPNAWVLRVSQPVLLIVTARCFW
jgi:hypothetical protein